MPIGKLHVNVATASGLLPLEGARVVVRDNQWRVLHDVMTDANGMTGYMDLEAPNPALTLNPNTAAQGYSVYEVEVTHPGFQRVTIHNTDILAGETSYLPVHVHSTVDGRRAFMGELVGGDLIPLSARLGDDEFYDMINDEPPHDGIINIPPIGAADGSFSQVEEDGRFARVSPVAEVGQPINEQDATETVWEDFDDVYIDSPAVLLSRQSGNIGSTAQTVRRVFIPTFITVHLGTPQNTAARNVRVPFVEYIANVASSEIFATWPDASLRANIHAIVGFTLNRVYTEWYRSRGFNFDITNSTTVDQKFVYGRNIFQNLMQISQEIFNQYARRIGFRNPFFTQYCDGRIAWCQGLRQWETVTLADQGFTPLQILRRFYGQDIELSSTDLIQDIRSTYPGTPMRLGSPPSRYIQLMQQYLNRIRQNFPLIPRINAENGVFGADTDAAVRQFQRTFNLASDGVIGPSTWNKITQIWVAVTRLAELDSEGERIGIGARPPSVVLRQGSSGNDVRELQWLLSYIGQFYEFVPQLAADGVFGALTANSVREFQRNFGLTPDGIVGPMTWNRLYEVFRSIQNTSPNPPTTQPEGDFSGTVTTQGGNLNLRAAPSLSAQIIGSIPNGTRLVILGEQNRFYSVRTPQGTEGWVSVDFVRPVVTTGVVRTQGGNLNFRSGPSIESPIIGSIPNGTSINILDMANDFYRIRLDGREGFVSSDFVRVG